MEAWYSAEKNPSGKRSLIFQAEGGFGLPINIPCGRCLGCRLDRTRDWAIRLMHEAHFHDRKSFVTLTYSDEHLPSDGSLDVRHVQLFLKRLRAAMAGDGVGKFDPPLLKRVRFFAVGEYGPKTQRPHYHLVLFGVDFREDRKVCGVSRKGGREYKRYRSERLELIWGLGSVEIGTLTEHSAGYVARYSVKKVYGDRAEAHYAGRKPEFMTCSKGIGRLWWELYGEHASYRDYIVFGGKETPLPKFYDKLIAEESEERLAEIKSERKEKALEHWENNTQERLAVRGEVKAAKTKVLLRGL